MSKSTNLVHQRPKLSVALAPLKRWIKSVHRCCQSVPRIGQNDFNNLVESIREFGLQQPILVDTSGLLLDGRSRIMACFVAGVSITEDDIETSDKDPEAVAQANIARRHLTEDQKIMKAVSRDLARQRQLAAYRRRRSADAKRKYQQDQLGTDFVPSKKGKEIPAGKKREPKAIDLVAKATGISRDKLKRGETLAKKDPVLAEEVEIGNITLSDAEKQAGIEPKKRRTKPKKKSKAGCRKNVPKDYGNSEVISFCDKHSKIVDHANGMRVITSIGTFLFQYPDLEIWAIAFRDQDTWRVSTTTGHEKDSFGCQSEALARAESLIAAKLVKPAE